MVRFIHAADLHLDSPFIGLKSLPEVLWERIYQATFQSLTKVVDNAIEKEVDFVCLAGDIYDSDDRSVKAQAYLRKELLRLEKAMIPVFICHGNHDYIENLGLHLDMPKNVIIFQEQVDTHWLTTKSGERIAITSFSYSERWVKERRISDYPNRLPEATYQIGMLHGSIEGVESEHGVYAPFSLAELKSKHYDYWALGHIHKRQNLNQQPLIVYSGNTQGRSRKEMGPKGCEFVELTLAGEKHEFLPTASIIWNECEISLKGMERLGEVYQAIQKQLEILQTKEFSQFLVLNLTDTADLKPTVKKKIIAGGLLDALQEEQQDSETFLWVYKIHFIEEKRPVLELNFLQEEWQIALTKMQEESQFIEATNFLFNQIGNADYLEKRESIYRNEIIADAKELILEQLGSKGSEADED